MKKLLTLGLAFMLALSTVSCGNKEVTLELPSTYVGERTVEEVADDLDIEDVTKITINADGTATAVMTEKQIKAERDELDQEYTEKIKELYEEGSDDKIPSFVKIENDKAYTKFDIYVDSASFTEIDKIYAMVFLITGQIMQSFDGVAEADMDVKVTYYDNATKEELHSISLKEVLAATGQ